MGCCLLSSNAFFHTKNFEGLRNKFTSIVALESLHLLPSVLLHGCLEFNKLGENFTLLPHEVDPTLSEKIINKNNIVFMFCRGRCRKGSTNIRVDLLQDCIYSALSIMESGFNILPQCAALADILLVKRAFKEPNGNLLHDL